MKHCPRLTRSIVTAFLMVFLTVCLTVSESVAKPNFVFILADDLGVKDIGVEGSTYYETPHIDALAAGGMRFTQGYATCQVCSPSRASILTGKFPARHGITDWIGAAQTWGWKRNGRVLPRRIRS